MKYSYRIALSALIIMIISPAFRHNPEKTFSPLLADEYSADFQLIKNGKAIKLYSRWIKVTEQRYARQLKAMFIIHAAGQDIISIIKDENLTETWIKGVAAFYNIKPAGFDQWYSYTLFKVPWPFNNQDLVSKYQMVKLPDKSITISIVSVPDLVPVKKDISRVKHYQAVWKFVPLPDGVTSVEYSVFSNQEPKYPRWITDPIIQDNLMRSLAALRNLAECQQK